MNPWNEEWTEQDTQKYAEEMNRIYFQRLNVERLAEMLRKAANSGDKIINCVKIIEEACKRNPKGLPF